jgi:chromosome partitioning protein
MAGITESVNPKSLVLNIKDGLDLIPNAVDFSGYPRFLDSNFAKETEKISFLKTFIAPLIDDYDFIFLDVPPTLSLLNDTAFYACDQIVIVLQTQERSLSGAEVFLQYIQTTLIDEYDAKCDVLGILPVLSKRNSKVDEEILRLAAIEFGEEYIFENKISIMERVKRMDMHGITDNDKDIHDKKVHEAFGGAAKELIQRLEEG